MPRTLVLTRHAKSDWGGAGLADHDRPLNPRGRAAAPRIGDWIAERARPEAALVSTARRAVETWEGLATALAPAPAVDFVPSLYHAAPETMLEVLRGASGNVVLMVGHNPGIASFAGWLLARPPEDAEFARYPTAATTIARFDIAEWTELRPGTGTLVDFTVPRRLAP